MTTMRRKLSILGCAIAVALEGLAYTTAAQARLDDQVEFQKYLAEEIRSGMLPELKKFKQEGTHDWGRLVEKKLIIPAVEKTIFGKRIVVTPRIEKTIKYKDGDWHRYTAEADNPDQNLKVEVIEFKQPAKNRATFTVRLQAKLKVTGDVAFYKLDVGAQIPVAATADLILLADCVADLTVRGNDTDIVLKVEPRALTAPVVVMTQLGPLKGNEAKKAGELLSALFADDFNKKRDELLNRAKDEIRKAILKARIKTILIDLLLGR